MISRISPLFTDFRELSCNKIILFFSIYIFTDTFKNGIRRNERQIIEQTDHDPGRYTIATPMEIFQRMVRNLVTSAQIQEQEIMSRGTFTLLRSALELTKLIGGVNENPGFALCQIYLQLSINHREIIKELDNYENWPLNLWFGGDMEHLKNQVRGLRRMCIVSYYCDIFYYLTHDDYRFL